MHTASETSISSPRVASPARAAPSTLTVRSARGTRSLGRDPERDRLERRAERVRQVIHALRERATVREGQSGGAPRPLTAAIEDFGRELAELERRLRHTGT